MPEYAFSLTRIFLNKVRIEDPVLLRENVTRCTIWYYLYNLKTWKTPMEEIFTFFKLYKWYQIAQSVTCGSEKIHILAHFILWNVFQILKFDGNEAKEQISKRALQEKKAGQIFWKTNISCPMIRTRGEIHNFWNVISVTFFSRIFACCNS